MLTINQNLLCNNDIIVCDHYDYHVDYYVFAMKTSYTYGLNRIDEKFDHYYREAFRVY